MYEVYANSVKFAFGLWGNIKVKSCHKDLKLIGIGRSACVFLIKETEKVIKVFPSKFHHVAKEEAEIYAQLTQISSFPSVYASGRNFIVMDYIKGFTLFDCLQKGIEIQEEQVKEIDRVMQLVRSKGLNPSDVHLRNILLTTDQQVKIIDVARYKQTKQCKQWDDLRDAYFHLYAQPFFPRRLPRMLMHVIGRMYKNNLIPFYTWLQK